MSKPAKAELSILVDSTFLNSTKMDSELDISINKSQLLKNISPTLTPNGHITKMFDKNFPQTARPAHNEHSTKQTRRNSRSPLVTRVKIDFSEDDYGHKLLSATSNRRTLESQMQLMENRIKKLRDEDSKIKKKIKQTKEKTQNMLSSRTNFMNNNIWVENYKKELEKSIQDKRAKIAKMKYTSMQKKLNNQYFLVQNKINNVTEIKQQKAADQVLREELKREEAIKKQEKIWRIAIHQKNVENSKIFNRLKREADNKREYYDRLEEEVAKTEKVTKNLLKLEDLENQLLDKLKITHNNHVNAYNDLQKVVLQSPFSRRTSKENYPSRSLSPLNKHRFQD